MPCISLVCGFTSFGICGGGEVTLLLVTVVPTTLEGVELLPDDVTRTFCFQGASPSTPEPFFPFLNIYIHVVLHCTSSSPAYCCMNHTLFCILARELVFLNYSLSYKNVIANHMLWLDERLLFLSLWSIYKA